ncbi:MAG: hypothetical protein V7708_13040 [Oceanicoccus sp.]
MDIGSWAPNSEQTNQPFDVERANLDAYIEMSRSDKLNELPTLLSSHLQTTQSDCMRLSKDQWFAIAKPLNDEEIKHLMRFFTIAEKLPGWDAGARSPVIWLGKLLKQRGVGINREMVVWIKSNSNNQFLPHGAL